MLDRLTNVLKTHAAGLDRASGQAKFAIVSSVNPQTGYARVIIQPDGVLSGWLPVLSSWVGNGWGMVCPPKPGDQVFVVPQEGDVEQGVIVGRAFSTKQMPPSAPDGELWFVHQSGSFLKLCNDGTIRLSGDLHVQGDIFDSHGTLSGLRATYDTHTHNLPSGGTTAVPNQVN
jgi:uncharacterized protein involved in type VI secretion and phage assembly